MKLCIRSNKKESIFFKKRGFKRGHNVAKGGTKKTAPSTQRLSYTTLVANQMIASVNVSKIDD